MTPAVVSGPSGKTTIAGRAIGGAVLGTISNLSASAGDTTIAASWTAAANATSHQPQYKTSASETWLDAGALLGGSAGGPVTITGLTNGTAYDVRVIAGDGSTSTESNVVSRTPAAPLVLGALDNNLPAGGGWALVTDQDFETWADPMVAGWQDPMTSAWWSIATNREGNEDPSVIADATAPSGANAMVFRQSYYGVRDGYEPKFPVTGLGGGLEVFMGFYVKFANTWANPAASGIKWHIFNAMQDGSSQSALWLGTGREPNGAPETVDEPNMGMVFNGSCAEMTEAACGVPESEGAVRFQLRAALGTGLMTRGSWHKVQYYMHKGGAGTTGSGIVRIWLNDALIVDHDGFTWGDPGGAWQSCQLGATWGGGVGASGYEGTVIHYDRFMIYSR